MNRLIFISAILFATSAFAQQPTPSTVYTITITAQELDTIGNGLGSMPFKDAAPLINKLREQVMAQNKSIEAPKVDAPAK